MNEYGGIGGTRIGKGNRNTRRTPAEVTLSPPQTQHDLTWDRSRVDSGNGDLLTGSVPSNLGQYTVYAV
jgi:hypothetical protein